MNEDLKTSKTSFTNKDFNEVYPELLGIAKDLSYKWDPTVSNESDPGVTLIKEIAIALDKINYSSDKNALESMPLSVTQERTARQLFQLLGYYPKWFISSVAKVSLAWKAPEDKQTIPETKIKIPAFTQITDSSGEYVYTITEDVILGSDGEVQECNATQGILKSLEINKETLITQDLIKNNRVYIPDYNVAQNGIFIYSKDAKDSTEINERTFWTQKDNLFLEESGNTYYSFNVDIASGRCYLEFPNDYSELIGDGIYIDYLISSGKDGVVGIRQLNSLLYDSSVNAKVIDSDEVLSLTSEDLFIQNTDLIETGKNPESIDSMYVNYNHIKGTFDTLVTLKDYNNAVYDTKLVSNAVVCDRTDDVQESYRIKMQTLDDSERIYYAQENDDKKLSPFGLKIYALQYNDLTETNSSEVNKSAYDNTFEMYADLDCENPFNWDSSLRQLTLVLNDDKCSQHDFKDIEANKICLLKNVAEISLTVFPTISLTTLQKENLISDIKNQIYMKYNARQIKFGQEINYDDLFTNLLTSNNLIKNISLNQIQYYTYALYYSQGEHLIVNEYKEGAEQNITLQDKWRQVCVSDEIDYIHTTLETDQENAIVVYTSPSEQKWFNAYLGWPSDSSFGSNTNISSQYANNRIYLVDQQGIVYYLNEDNRVVLYSTRRNDFRKEILAKNILAGITPLVTTKEKGFDYQLDETDYQVDSVQKIGISTQMVFDFNGQNEATYCPKDNEVIQLVKPQLSNAVTYGAYIKYDYKGQTVSANANHRLSSDETLVIYYKTEDGDGTPYTRVVYQGSPYDGAIISPNFELQQTTTTIELLSDATITPSSTRICNASQQISIKEINKVELNNATNYVYVVGDEVNGNYVLNFVGQPVDGQSEYRTYITTLQGTQQFIYSSTQQTYLNIVGSGTKISIDIPITNANAQKDTYTISNEIISSRNIQLYGVQALAKKWAKLPFKVTVLAQEFINVIGTATDDGDEEYDSYVTLVHNGSSLSSPAVLDRDGLHWEEDEIFSNVNKDYQGIRNCSSQIRYTDDNSNDRIQEVSVTQEENLFDFVNGEYGQNEYDSYTNQISLTSSDYEQKELSGIYFQGSGPTTQSGIVTSSFKTTTDRDDTYYLIDGTQLFIVQDKYNEQGAIIGHGIQEITGFADALNGPGNIKIPSSEFTESYSDGRFIYRSNYCTIPIGCSLYLVNDTPIEEIGHTSEIGNKIVGRMRTNTTEPGGMQIEFDSAVRMHRTDAGHEGQFLYTGYILKDYYEIDDITIDYNTDASGAYPYSDPSLAYYGAAPAVTSNNDNGHPKGFVTIVATEVAGNRKITFPLLQEFWEYASHNFANDYYDQPSYVPTKDDFVSTTPVTVDRKWEYQDVNGNTKYILDSTLRNDIFDYAEVPLVDRGLDNWVWPIDNYSINFIVQQNFVTPDWNQDYTYSQGDIISYSGKAWESNIDNNQGNVPQEGSDAWFLNEQSMVAGIAQSEFTVIYKNRGDSETSEVTLGDDPTIDWSIYGLGFLDYQNKKPIRLYENQTLNLIVPDGKKEIAVTEGAGGKVHLQVNSYLIDTQVGDYSDPETEIDEDFDFVYSYCSDDLYIEGLTEYQSTKLIDEDNNEYYPSILTSAFNQGSGFSKEVQQGKIITFTEDTLKTLTINLPTGSSKYIFKINNYQDLAKLNVSFKDVSENPSYINNVYCLNAEAISQIWDLKLKGVYYFMVDSVSEFSTTVDIESLPQIISSDMINDQIENVETAVRVEIFPVQMIEIDQDTDIYAVGENEILAEVQRLAKIDGRDAFDYFYQPSGDKLILNPLQSASFNNQNHFYNPYTICKIRTYDSLNDSNIFINS